MIPPQRYFPEPESVHEKVLLSVTLGEPPISKPRQSGGALLLVTFDVGTRTSDKVRSWFAWRAVAEGFS